MIQLNWALLDFKDNLIMDSFKDNVALLIILEIVKNIVLDCYIPISQ